MLVFSLLFYAAGEPIYVLLLVGMAFIDWLLALYIERQPLKSRTAKLGIVLTCVVDLGMLGIFKYGTFFLKNFNLLFGVPSVIPKIALPIGISFYTFQLLSYMVDVYRGEVEAQKHFPTLLLYVSLFHQCIAGPIVRYSDVQSELLYRRTTVTDLSDGIWLFTVGLGKKAILANTCAAAADSLIAADGSAHAFSQIAHAPALQLWLGVIIYSMYIYLDFSAYSDMAIGMGKMIGIHYMENFNYPYIADSVTEFWRRWHISLSRFFRDYVYIPLGGNRKGQGRLILNLLIVWGLTGFWHGASWNFLLWGLYFFVFLTIEKLWLLKRLNGASAFLRHLYLLVVVAFGWIIFRYTDMGLGGKVVLGMFGFNRNGFYSAGIGALIAPHILLLLFSVLAVTPLFKHIGVFCKKIALKNNVTTVVYGVGRVAIPIVLLVLSTAALVGNSFNPFLYFRF